MNKHSGNLLKSYFEQEINHSDVQKAKKAFIHKSEKLFSEPSLHWIPMISVSSIAAACLIAVVWFYPTTFLPQPKPEPTVLMSSPTVPDGSEEVILTPDEHAVVVKRLTSSVGPTMIYQKMYQDHPLTVIWVFSKEVQS